MNIIGNLRYVSAHKRNLNNKMQYPFQSHLKGKTIYLLIIYFMIKSLDNYTINLNESFSKINYSSSIYSTLKIQKAYRTAMSKPKPLMSR